MDAPSHYFNESSHFADLFLLFANRPFLIDLESSNGSFVNDTEIPTSRYYQLSTGDTLTFGASTREYVLLDESSS